MPRVTENSLKASVTSWGRWGLLPGTDKRHTALAFPPYGIHLFNAERSLHLQ